MNEALVSQAQELTGLTDLSAVVNEALGALVQRECARRLALLGGSEPRLRLVPRRRPGRQGADA